VALAYSLLQLSEPAKKKILAKTKRLKRQVATELKLARPP